MAAAVVEPPSYKNNKSRQTKFSTDIKRLNHSSYKLYLALRISGAGSGLLGSAFLRSHLDGAVVTLGLAFNRFVVNVDESKSKKQK